MKRILRFLPRRAVLHKYPLIGRFAAQLRPRSYLWSFRRPHLRRAYYAGSVISFLPLMGIQTPIALVAALVLRCNFMVLGGLQFITNPVTAAPVYFATHALGAKVIEQFAAAPAPAPAPAETEMAALGSYVGETVSEPVVGPAATDVHWTKRARAAIAAMVVGGVIVGLCFGALLDLVDAFFRALSSTSPVRRRRSGLS